MFPPPPAVEAPVPFENPVLVPWVPPPALVARTFPGPDSLPGTANVSPSMNVASGGPSGGHAGDGPIRSGPATLGSGLAYRKNPPPRYPPEALAHRQEGIVVVRAAVASGGQVSEVSVARTSGFPLLDDAAAAAVKRWEFEPARIRGEGLRTIVEVPVRFYLTSDHARDGRG